MREGELDNLCFMHMQEGAIQLGLILYMSQPTDFVFKALFKNCLRHCMVAK